MSKEQKQRKMVTMDGNEAVASVAHRINEVIAIYPITPSSNMGEWADEWSAKGKKNIWGLVPTVVEMQSEGGAAGAVHGALQAGALTTTFTASQGLLLMIPNMYKIAGELTAVRACTCRRAPLATHALSIFGDHSDVMAVRQTGFALLASNSVQEAHDFALIAQRATLRAGCPSSTSSTASAPRTRWPRSSSSTDDDLPADDHRRPGRGPPRPRAHPGRPGDPRHRPEPRRLLPGPRGLQPASTPTPPSTCRRPWTTSPSWPGASTSLFDYVGHPEAERVIVIMGSGAETGAGDRRAPGRQGREGRPASRSGSTGPSRSAHFMTALPRTTTSIAVLDRTKEPGASASRSTWTWSPRCARPSRPTSTASTTRSPCIGGRYGLSSKEFTPAMVKAVFDELGPSRAPSATSRSASTTTSPTSRSPTTRPSTSRARDVVRALFYGLGADGTVGANKNSIKIIGEDTPNFAQGYFVYDSKKSGSVTISPPALRAASRSARSYLVTSANFVACHQFGFLEKYEMLDAAAPGAIFLLNSPLRARGGLGASCPPRCRRRSSRRSSSFYVIDAVEVARDTGMGVRINTIMQTCFFAISGVLPRDEAIEHIKKTIEKTYGRKGAEVVQQELRGRRRDAGPPPRGEDRRQEGRPASTGRRRSPSRRPTS